MKKSEKRTEETLKRVRQHGQERIAAFPANTRGHELYAVVGMSAVNMEKYSAEQAVHAHAYSEKSAQRAVADEALRVLMKTINRTARSMTREFPGAKEKFRLPSSRDGDTWLVTARGFTTDAVAFAEEFVRRGIASDFIDELKVRIQAVDEAKEGQARAWAARVKATAHLAEAAELGLASVRELDAIVRNIYADNEAELVAWESASRVERTARHEEEDEEEESTAAPEPTQA